MLQNVRIEATETQLVAVATDRFLLGASRADYAGEAFTVSIEGQQVDALLRMAKTASQAATASQASIAQSACSPESRSRTRQLADGNQSPRSCLSLRPTPFTIGRGAQRTPV